MNLLYCHPGPMSQVLYFGEKLANMAWWPDDKVSNVASWPNDELDSEELASDAAWWPNDEVDNVA